MLSNAYFLANFRFDTAENEPTKNLQILQKKIISLNGTCEGEGEESGPHLLVGAAEAGGQGGLLLLRRAEVRAELARLPGKPGLSGAFVDYFIVLLLNRMYFCSSTKSQRSGV